MATALSTSGAELIGFQSQLCRVSRIGRPSRALLTRPLFRSAGHRERARLTRARSPAAGRRRVGIRYRGCRLRCIFHEVSPAEFGIARIQGSPPPDGTRDGQRGSERRYSRVIKGSPGRTDAKINKPAVMNEAGSLESGRIYPVLIVTEIRALPLGADTLNQFVAERRRRAPPAIHLGFASIEGHYADDSDTKGLIEIAHRRKFA